MENFSKTKSETPTSTDSTYKGIDSLQIEDKSSKESFQEQEEKGQREKGRGEFENDFQACQSRIHTKKTSPYPKDKVPKSLFRKDPNDPKSRNCKSCFDCRATERLKKKNKKEKIELANSQDSEFGTCSSSSHKKASKYPKDKVPKNLFRKYMDKPNSVMCETCCDCRKHAMEYRRLHEEKLKKVASNIDAESEVQVCFSTRHSASTSIYPRDEVPKKMFLRDPNDPESEKLDKCFDCREARRIYSAETRAKLKQEVEAKKEDPNSEVLICMSIRHYLSSYKRDEVPRHMFLKFPDNPKSPLLDTCSDCRAVEQERAADFRSSRKANLGENEFCCGYCNKVKPLEEQGTNLNGEKSASCKNCVIIRKEYMEDVVEFKKEIKKEIIRKNECSCEICKKIYLKPETSNSGVIELSTYEIDNISYVTYKDKEYRVDDFLDEFEELLELRILEHDHLTEEEQRERGLLGENDVFVPKKCNVSVLQGEDSTRLETAKTQLIDSKCHLGETKRRAGKNLYPRTKFYEEKLAYVNNLKCKGCAICGFYDPNCFVF